MTRVEKLQEKIWLRYTARRQQIRADQHKRMMEWLEQCRSEEKSVSKRKGNK